MGPEFQELPFVFHHVPVISNLGGGFQFYPMDGIFLALRFAIPDCEQDALEHDICAVARGCDGVVGGLLTYSHLPPHQ